MEPSLWDILQGRDQLSIRHVGNKCFREVVCSNLEHYKTLSTTTEQKNKFCNAIVESILISGGRFLRRQADDKGWEEIDKDEAKVKVRRAFRDAMVMRRKRSMTHQEGSPPVIKPIFNGAGLFDWKGMVSKAQSDDRTSSHEVILEPTEFDILHGRDDFSIHHIGNVCFRSMIGCSLQGYASLTTRLEKSEYLSAVVDTIHKSGGRFLQRRPRGEGWEQDDFQKAKQTVGQALRDFNKKSEVHLESSLRNLYNLFYATAHDFHWKSMVKTAQRLQSERQNSSLEENAENSREVGTSLNSELPPCSYLPYGVDSVSHRSNETGLSLLSSAVDKFCKPLPPPIKSNLT